MPLILKDFDYSAARRGWDEIEGLCEDSLLWPKCEITGCSNGICIGMSKSVCYPHGIEFGIFTVEEFEADRKARHAS